MWVVVLLGCIGGHLDASPAPGHSPEAPADTGAPEGLPGDTDTAGDTGEDTAKVDTADPHDDPVEEALAAEQFYAFGELQEVRLYLDEATINALNRDARRGQSEYLAGDVVVNGARFDHIGVRIKGSSTLRDFDDKPSLKIKFNAFEKGRDFAGLERITLNNMVEDSTQTKEVLVYKIFREAGVLGSRANHAALYVNDELYGLYTNLETADDHWLGSRFADPSGELFEANDGADFTRGGVGNWESASGTGDAAPLDAVVAALRGAGDDYFADLDTVVHMDQFFDFWAWSLLVGNVDGYPWTLNDCYVYADPLDASRLQFAPWGVDESWNAGAPSAWSSASGALAAGCMRNEACKAEFVARMPVRLEQLAAYDVAGWHALDAASSAEVLAADTRRTFRLDAVEAARAELLTTIAGWPDRIREAMRL